MTYNFITFVKCLHNSKNAKILGGRESGYSKGEKKEGQKAGQFLVHFIHIAVQGRTWPKNVFSAIFVNTKYCVTINNIVNNYWPIATMYYAVYAYGQTLTKSTRNLYSRTFPARTEESNLSMSAYE